MAHLNEEVVVIKISELLKDTDEANTILDEAMVANLEAVIQEIAGVGKLVEIAKG
jgi:hypothetical protein